MKAITVSPRRRVEIRYGTAVQENSIGVNAKVCLKYLDKVLFLPHTLIGGVMICLTTCLQNRVVSVLGIADRAAKAFRSCGIRMNVATIS